jgi:hypothetical protein
MYQQNVHAYVEDGLEEFLIYVLIEFPETVVLNVPSLLDILLC